MPKNYHLFLKGTVGEWNFSSDMVNYVLDKHKAEAVHVLVNSLGGYTSDGLSISSLFKLHGNVHVHYVGMNASAATIAAMGAKRITIDADACFLVHKCMNLVFECDWLNSDEIETRIKALEKMKANQDAIDSCVASMYARRCKKSKEELLALMSKDSWLTAQQALEWGFVDEITDRDTDKTEPLSEASLASLASAGIPLPPSASVDRKPTMVERIAAFLQSITHSGVSSDQPEPSPTPSPEMKKFTALSALMGASLSAGADCKFFITEEQATALESAIESNRTSVETLTASVAEKEQTIAQLNAAIAEKDGVIADLRKEPAATTSAVNDEGKDAPDPYAPVSEADAIAASKAFLASTL